MSGAALRGLGSAWGLRAGQIGKVVSGMRYRVRWTGPRERNVARAYEGHANHREGPRRPARELPRLGPPSTAPGERRPVDIGMAVGSHERAIEVRACGGERERHLVYARVAMSARIGWAA